MQGVEHICLPGLEIRLAADFQLKTIDLEVSRVPMREKILKRILHALLFVVLWGIAINAVVTSYRHGLNNYGFDFYQYWVGGDVVRQFHADRSRGALDLYSHSAFRKLGQQYLEQAQHHSRRQRDAAASRAVLETVATPFSYWLFSVAAPGNYDTVFQAYIPISIAGLAIGVAAIAWRLGYSLAMMGAAIAIASMSAPFYSDLGVVNLNGPQLAITAGYLLLRDRARRSKIIPFALLFLSGAVLGLLVASKPYLVLLAVLLGIKRLLAERRQFPGEAFGFTVGLGGAILISSWRFGGLNCWIQWLRSAKELGGQPVLPSASGNLSFTRTIFEYTGMNVAFAMTIILLAVALAAIWKGSRSAPLSRADSIFDHDECERQFGHDLSVVGIAGSIVFMTAGFAWLHYPIQIYPFLLLAGSRLWTFKTFSLVNRPIFVANIVRVVLFSACVILLMIPQFDNFGGLIPGHFEVRASTWVYCSQTALLFTLTFAVWFEARLINMPPSAHAGIPVKIA